MTMRRAAELLIFFSIATLFYRKEVLYLLKPFEIGIVGAVICLLIYALNTKRNLLKEIPNLSLWLTLFALMLFFSILGTVNGYRLYGIADPVKTIGGFFYLVIDMTAFLLTLYYGRSFRFRNIILTSFISPLIFSPLIFMPDRAEKMGFVSDKIHFFGLHKNPTTLAFLLSIAFVVLIGKYFEANGGEIKTLYATGIIFSISLSLWTGSRAAWLAMALSFVWIAFYRRIFSVKGHILLATALAIMTVSFAILPHRTQLMAFDRIYPQISGTFPDSARLDRTSLKTAFAFLTTSLPSLPYQSRQSLWPQSIELFLTHPLGLGVEYFRSAQLILQNTISTHSHNTALQTLLTGGIGLFSTCLFFLHTIIKKISYAKKDREWLVITSILINCSIFLTISEYFYIIPWIWIILALAYIKTDNKSAVPTA